MANVIIKSEEQKRYEQSVLHSFGVQGKGTAEQREAAEIIAARSEEAIKGGKK